MVEPEIFLAGLFQIDRDVGRMVEGVLHHLLVVLGFAALDVPLPHHALFVENLVGDEQLVAVHEILLDEGVDEQEVVHVLAHVEDVVLAGAGALVELASLLDVEHGQEFLAVAALVGGFLDEVEQPHAQCIRVEPHPRHGGDPGIYAGEIHLVAGDAVVAHEQGFVPVAGPAFVHGLGADLGLEIQRSLANDMQDRLHPPVFLAVEELGVVDQELDQVAPVLRLEPVGLFVKGGELRMLPVNLLEKFIFAVLAVFGRRPVVALDLLHVFVHAHVFLVLEEHVEVVVQLFGLDFRGGTVQVREHPVEVHHVVDRAGELDDVVHPAPLFAAQLGDGALVGQGLAGEIVVPGVLEEQVVLEEVDVPQNVVEDHHVQPVGVVVVVEADGRPRVDHRLERIVRVQLVTALALQHLDVVHPVVVHGGDHDLGRKLQQVAIGHHVLEGFVVEAQAGIAGALLASLHDGLGMLIDQLHDRCAPIR